MGNLGRYQEIVQAAKAVGGVDNLIGNIEAGAVAKATPGLLGKGAALGAAGLATVVGAGAFVRRAWVDRKAREVLAEESKEALKAVVADATTSDTTHTAALEGAEGTTPEGGGGATAPTDEK